MFILPSPQADPYRCVEGMGRYPHAPGQATCAWRSQRSRSQTPVTPCLRRSRRNEPQPSSAPRSVRHPPAPTLITALPSPNVGPGTLWVAAGGGGHSHHRARRPSAQPADARPAENSTSPPSLEAQSSKPSPLLTLLPVHPLQPLARPRDLRPELLQCL